MKKSSNLDSEEPKFSYNQAVILEIAMDLDFGEAQIQSAILELEETITKNLPADCSIDGHEFGEGLCIIYIYGPKADEIWHSVESALKESEFGRIDVTLQYGRPDDPKTKDKKFTL